MKTINFQFEEFRINDKLLLELKNDVDNTSYKVIKLLCEDIQILRRDDIKIEISEHSLLEITFQQEKVRINVWKAPVGNNIWSIGKIRRYT